MMRYIIIQGVQYENETTNDMKTREREMVTHNNLVDEQERDWCWQKRMPMMSMRKWAVEHGLLDNFEILERPTCSK